MAAYQFVNSKGVTYYLHKKDVVLRGDRAQTIYFFSKQIGGKSGKEQAIEQLPEGRTVTENPRNGFPTLKKIA